SERFFFSSRRRHTRSKRDWSSDVCSSDLFYIESCATSTEEIGRSLHPGAKTKLDEMGIPNERRRARQLTRQDYDRFDYLLCMDRSEERRVGKERSGGGARAKDSDKSRRGR